MLRKVKKGNHIFRPIPFNFTDRLHYKVRFDESNMYTIADDDKNDWNKLIVLNFDLLGQLKNKKYIPTEAVMIAYRRKPNELKIELAPYFHAKSNGINRLMGDEIGKVFEIGIHEWAEVEILKKGYEYTAIINGDITTIETKCDSKKGWETWSNFGGQKTSPRDSIIEFTKI